VASACLATRRQKPACADTTTKHPSRLDRSGFIDAL
jgi:hypothetical protein